MATLHTRWAVMAKTMGLAGEQTKLPMVTTVENRRNTCGQRDTFSSASRDLACRGALAASPCSCHVSLPTERSRETLVLMFLSDDTLIRDFTHLRGSYHPNIGG